jgi:hypothetical protein
MAKHQPLVTIAEYFAQYVSGIVSAPVSIERKSFFSTLRVLGIDEPADRS